MTVDFDAIPRSVVDGGSVRFFPRTTSTKPVTEYDWDFGDGDTSTEATPIHVYAGTGSYATYDVNLTLTYADASTEAATEKVSFIASDLVTNIPAVQTDGTNIATSVFLYDNESVTKYMLVNRGAWTGSNYYLIDPKATSSIDKLGTATFTLLDPGDSTSDEQTLVAEGINVIILMGKSVIFSGVIRRVTQALQAAFLETTKVRQWDIECDSDLVRLQKTNITSSALSSDGAPIIDTPGYIARRILTPASTRDSRGVIGCVDTKISYQLNPSTISESVGNQFDHLESIHAQTNYDLVARPDYLIYPYTSFDGSTVVTNSGAAWSADEFIGNYLFFVGRDSPASKTFTTNYGSSTSEILVTTASTFFAVNDRVGITTTGTLPTGLSSVLYYVKTVTSDHLTLSLTLTGATVTFSTNGTGTHSIILIPDLSGVTTYGKITDNDATTITCAAMVGASTAPTSLGYFIIYRGFLVDFAHDISQPSPVVNLDVNSTCFEYSDNDDKRKLSTKIVATGKDLQGKTISVALSGSHAYDNDTQAFEDSTFITKKSEGYVYKCNYASSSAPKSATAYLNGSFAYYTTTDLTGCFFYSSSTAYFTPLAKVTVSSGGGVPSGTWYCYNNFGNGITVSSTRGGSPYNVTQNVVGGTMSTPGFLFINNSDGFLSLGQPFIVTATSYPGGLSAGVTYYAVGDLGTSSAEPVYVSTAAGGSPISITSAGSGVAIIKRTTASGGGLIDPDPVAWLYGWDYVLNDTDEIAFVVPNVGSETKTVSGTPVESTDANGIKFTQVYLSDWLTTDYGGQGYMMNGILYVDSTSLIWTGSATEVLIGEEVLTIASVGTDTTYGNYIDIGAPEDRVTSDSKKCYPHDVGALVARTNYTEASPQTGSPIDLYKLCIDYRTVDNNITYGQLDAYATTLLLGLGNFYRKATTWSPLENAVVKQTGEFYGSAQVSRSRPIMVGDSITITSFDGESPSDPYEVVETTIICNEGRMMIQLGDFEKNAYTTLMNNTNALNNTLT